MATRDELTALLDEVEDYFRRRRQTLEREIHASDQSGPWDERDHLYEELDAVKVLAQRIQQHRARRGDPIT
jgi:hypothetical protein